MTSNSFSTSFNMQSVITACLVSLFTICIAYPRIKEVIVYNATENNIQVAIHTSSDPSVIGNAPFAPQIITQDQEFNFQEPTFSKKYHVNNYIHIVWYRDDGEKIILYSERNDRSDDKEFRFNVSKSDLEIEATNDKELENMQLFLSNEILDFKKQHQFALKLFDDADTSIPEHLGSIIIADMSEGLDEKDRVKYVITARQLGLSQKFKFSGRDKTNIYRFSKEFSAKANAGMPGIFSINLNFGDSDLIEAKYSIFKLGPVLFESEENISVFDLLNNFEQKSGTEVFITIANYLENCPNCNIYQVNRVLAFKNITVSSKKYKKMSFGMKGDAKSIVTAEGSFATEDEFSNEEIIDPRVIALGATSTSTTDIITSIRKILIQKIDDNNKILDNTRSELNRIRREVEDLEKKLAVIDQIIEGD